MRKSIKSKRKKFVSSTYMREAIDYDIITIKEQNLFITIKKYKEMNGKFSLTTEDNKIVDYIDKGYYVVELTPLEEQYNIRYYFDKNKKYIDYYIDITLENGVEYKMPYYIDLYLDIIHYPKSNRAMFCDEEELEEALEKGVISKKDYNQAYKVGNKLLKEIEAKTNSYLNIDVTKYINQYF